MRVLALACLVTACHDPIDHTRGTWIVDIDALAANERAAPLPPGPARTLAIDFVRDHYAGAEFSFDPPRCREVTRAGTHDRRCEVLRVERGRVVVFDLYHPDRIERLRLHVSRQGSVELERGDERLPLKRATGAR